MHSGRLDAAPAHRGGLPRLALTQTLAAVCLLAASSCAPAPRAPARFVFTPPPAGVTAARTPRFEPAPAGMQRVVRPGYSLLIPANWTESQPGAFGPPTAAGQLPSVAFRVGRLAPLDDFDAFEAGLRGELRRMFGADARVELERTEQQGYMGITSITRIPVRAMVEYGFVVRGSEGVTASCGGAVLDEVAQTCAATLDTLVLLPARGAEPPPPATGMRWLRAGAALVQVPMTWRAPDDAPTSPPGVVTARALTLDAEVQLVPRSGLAAPPSVALERLVEQVSSRPGFTLQRRAAFTPSAPSVGARVVYAVVGATTDRSVLQRIFSRRGQPGLVMTCFETGEDDTACASIFRSVRLDESDEPSRPNRSRPTSW